MEEGKDTTDTIRLLYLTGGAIYELYLLFTGDPLRWDLLRSVYHSGMPFYNTPMWFFVCLFSVNVFYYLISKFPAVVTHIIVGLCFAVGWYIEGADQTQLLMHRPFFLSVVYFHLGYLFHTKLECKICQKALWSLGGCVLVYLLANLLDQQCLWYVGDLLTQGNYLMNLVFSLSGTIVLYLVSLTLKKENAILSSLQVLGQYSLVVFASHRSVLNYIYEPLIRYIWPTVNYMSFLFIGIAFLLLVSLGLFKVLKHVHPVLVGIK